MYYKAPEKKRTAQVQNRAHFSSGRAFCLTDRGFFCIVKYFFAPMVKLTLILP
jgi:hypothetical protein